MTPVAESKRIFTPVETQRLAEEDKQALYAVMGILNAILLLALIGYTGVVLGIMVDTVTGVVAAGSVGVVSLLLMAAWAWSKVRPTTHEEALPMVRRHSAPAVMKKLVTP